MDLSNINLNPVPDPLIPPVPPPINPDVMQAINTASIGGSPIPSFGVNGQVLPSSDESLNLAGQHTGSPVTDENDGALYEKYKHVADACRLTSIPEDSVWGADVPTCPLPTAPPSAVPDLSGIKIPDFTQQPMPVVEHQTKLTDFIDPNDEVIDPIVAATPNSKILADTLPDGQPNAVSGAFPSVNALRPGPPPRPITGIPGYGEKGKLPVEHKPGSLHSANMEREGALAVSQATQQTKGHAAVEQAFQRDLEQGKQGQKRYPHAQSVLDKELREIEKQVPKGRKGKQAKTSGSNQRIETKLCPRCESVQIDPGWEMCIPCMQRLLVKVEERLGLEEYSE